MKKYLMLLLVASLLILTACTGKEPVQTTGQAFIGGTQGLVVAFEPLSIKEGTVFTMFDDDEFSLEVTVKNQGEETIAAGDVTVELIGISPNDFSGVAAWSLTNDDELEKISEFNPDGGEETLVFAERAKVANDVVGVQDFTWNANYKYNYKTHIIVDDVCFKEDLKDTRVCVVDEPKTFSVSGAPVTVTAVQEDTAGKGLIALTINIQNIGLGDITLVGEEFDARFDQVGFTVEDDQWDCKAGGTENKARLYKNTNTATIRCKLKEALKPNTLYASPVKLTLEYVYQDLVKETLRVKQSAE